MRKTGKSQSRGVSRRKHHTGNKYTESLETRGPFWEQTPLAGRGVNNSD